MIVKIYINEREDGSQYLIADATKEDEGLRINRLFDKEKDKVPQRFDKYLTISDLAIDGRIVTGFFDGRYYHRHVNHLSKNLFTFEPQHYWK